MTSPTLLVLAAGMGSRYGGLKQMEAFGPSGETILDYSIYDALRAGFGKVVFVIRHDIERQFRESIAARFADRIAVEYAFQSTDKLPSGFAAPTSRTKPWGTTQAVLMAAEIIHEPFAVINADDFYGAESYRVLGGHLRSASSGSAMVGFRLRNTLSDFGAVARGICQLNPDNTLQSVVELTGIEREGNRARNTGAEGCVTHLTGDEIVSMNMWGFTPKIFVQLEAEFQPFLKRNLYDMRAECYLPSAVNALIASHQTRVQVLSSGAAWFGVTYREDHSHVVQSIAQLIRAGQYPERLWA